MADAGLERCVPLLLVRSMDASLRFYVDGLGFRRTNQWIVDGSVRWCWLELGGAALMLQEFHPHPGRQELGAVGNGVSLNFVCRDALAFYHEVQARGVAAGRPFVGNRMWVTSMADPDGYQLHVESPTDAPEESEYEE